LKDFKKAHNIEIKLDTEAQDYLLEKAIA
jgi:hypothetical protein